MPVLALPVKDKTDPSKENIKSDQRRNQSALDGVHRYDARLPDGQGSTIIDFNGKDR